MDNSWQDPAAAWWAKEERARRHIGDINSMVAAFNPRSAYEVLPEPTDEAGKTALRLHVLRSVPTELLTTIGDALHNLRSCLDSVAYELAKRSTGGTVSAKQERAIYFPVCEDRDAFEEFLAHKHRQAVFGENELRALRCAQPFAQREEAASLGVTFPTTAAEEYKINEIARLEQLNNLDKHRYLPLLAWHYEIAYPDGETPITSGRFRKFVPFNDGDVIGDITWTGTSADPAANLTVVMGLTLAEDPGYATGLMDALDSWHRYITGWIVPRIFVVAAGNPPPMMIG